MPTWTRLTRYERLRVPTEPEADSVGPPPFGRLGRGDSTAGRMVVRMDTLVIFDYAAGAIRTVSAHDPADPAVRQFESSSMVTSASGTPPRPAQ